MCWLIFALRKQICNISPDLNCCQPWDSKWKNHPRLFQLRTLRHNDIKRMQIFYAHTCLNCEILWDKVTEPVPNILDTHAEFLHTGGGSTLSLRSLPPGKRKEKKTSDSHFLTRIQPASGRRRKPFPISARLPPLPTPFSYSLLPPGDQLPRTTRTRRRWRRFSIGSSTWGLMRTLLQDGLGVPSGNGF